MTKETEKEAFITLDFSGTEKKFTNINELREFMQSQQSTWSWLEQVAQQDSNLDEVWQTYRRYLMRVSQFIGEYEMSLTKRGLPTKLINLFIDQTETAAGLGFILAETPIALFIVGLKKRESPEVAGYALAILNNIKVKVDDNNPSAHQGVFWAEQYIISLEPHSVEAQQKIQNLTELAHAINLEKLHSELAIKNEQLIKETTDLKEQSSLLIQKAEDQVTEQASHFEDQAVNLTIDFEAMRKEAKVELANYKTSLTDFKVSFKEKVILDVTIKYWSDKHSRHRKIMVIMALLTFLIASSTAFVFSIFAISLFATTPEAIVFSNMVVNKIASIAPEFSKPLLDVIASTTAVHEIEISSSPTSGTTASDTTVSVFTSNNTWKFSIMLLISTFGVWLTRLSTKIFISNLHLETDAYERVTMFRTYFSLLEEGKGLDGDNRQLILETLFRPSSTGIIKDDGPANVLETLINTLKRR